MSIRILAVCRKDRQTKNGKVPINLRVMHKRKTRWLSLGITIKVEHWDDENNCIKTSTKALMAAQLKIDKRIEELQRKIYRLEVLGMEVNLDNLFETNGRKVRCSIGDAIMQNINRLESFGKYASASKYRSLMSSLDRFKSLDIRLDEIDVSFLRDFEIYLRKIGNVNNSIATKFAIFKATYNRALTEGLFVLRTTSPFVQYKVGSLWTRTRKRAITKSDVRALMALNIPSSDQNDYRSFARDIFLFSYFTAGINFTDIASLRYKDFYDGRISYSRNKTQKLLTFRLTPMALEIILKYMKIGASPDDYIFPILNREIHITSLQIYNRMHKVLGKVNRELKKLGEQIGLQIPLTTYVARHTYATVLKREGVNVALISESLGHSNIQTTQIYLDSFENSQIDEAMKHLL